MDEEKKKIVKVGEVEVDLEEAVRDLRGVKDIAVEIVQEMGERRVKQWQPKLNILAHASDIAEWDDILLNRYQPLYTNIKKECSDCAQGPCPLSEKKGLCGLSLEAYQAKISLLEACKGLSRQLTLARDLLNFSLKIFSREKEISFGPSIVYPTVNTAMLTGFYTKNLGDVDRALSYAEAQLSELLQSAYYGNESVKDFEEKTLHAGSLIFLAMEIAESIKMCCFDFYNAGKLPATEYKDFPKVETEVGMGTVEEKKPVLLFVGNDFLPAWSAIDYIKRNKLEEEIEVCGIGAVGHDIPRFYKKGKVLESAVKARKVIRAGIPDVIVATESCFNLDLLEEAKKVDAKVIAFGYKMDIGLEDRSEDTVDNILKDIIERDKKGVLITIPEKAGELAVNLVKEIKTRGKRKETYLKSEEEVKEEAAKCKTCDSCFNVCPNRLMISEAMTSAKEGDFEKLRSIYEESVFCGKCETACPEGIPIIELLISASKEEIKKDKYLMRAGRGCVSELEWRDLTFGFVLGGNGPGMVYLIGCGSYPGSVKDIVDMAKYFLERNCLVSVAGCIAADVAKYFDEEEKKYIFEQYIAAALLKGFINSGGCTAISHIPPKVCRGTMIGSGYTSKANWSQIVDYQYTRLPNVVIIWGGAAEEMYACAAGFARMGISVVVGPSGFKFKRYLMGDKHDRSRWWMYDGITGEKKEVEPCPTHMIVPVETKEEAIAMSSKLFHKPLALRDPRLASLEMDNETYKNFFGEYSDDWHMYVRSDQELHVMRRMEMLRLLERKHGWVLEGVRVKKARHRSGEIMDMKDYTEKYGIQLGRYSTNIPRLIIRK